VPTYQRRDEEVVDSMGNPISGVQIFVCYQPATTNVIPPLPLVNLYSDPLGANLLTSAPQTDAYGRASYYLLPGIFTVVYNSPQIAGQTLVLADQIVSSVTNLPQFNNDSSAAGTIKPSPNGVRTGFTLSAAPMPPASLVLMVNGQVIEKYALSNNQVVFETAPSPTSVITAVYAV
jgi:hypothetical protein